MKEIFKSSFLLVSILILILPVNAVPGELSEYGNFTEGSGLNKKENASRNYFDFDSGLICVAAGKTVDNGKAISADELVEEIFFLTDSPESEISPIWTSDGKFILYTVRKNESDNSTAKMFFESYRMKADGSEIERIGIGEGNLTGFSDLSLDGSNLLLMKSINSQTDLYLASLESGAVTPVAYDPQVSESWGSWCRLGKKITYTQTYESIPSQLWIVDRDGSNKYRLGTSEYVGNGKDWCPLGLRIIYSAKDLKDTYDLWVIDFYGTNQAQLTNTSYNEWNPSFSPDGKWIAYVSDDEGSPDIWIRDIEGNYKARLTNNTGSPDSVPKWSPDGSKIAFAGYNRENSSITDTTNTDMINSSNNTGSNDDVANGSGIDAANASNISAIDNQGIDQISNSNTAAVDSSEIFNGSDIVIIKLRFDPYIPPSPKISNIDVNPLKGVSQEGNITISITVMNEGKSTDEGYISISFPGNEKIEGIEGTGSNINIYPAGSKIMGENGEMIAQYTLVELTEYEWSAGQEEILNVTVRPNNETEDILFFVRAALKDDRTETYRKDPLLSADRDQQGFAAYRYLLKAS